MEDEGGREVGGIWGGVMALRVSGRKMARDDGNQVSEGCRAGALKRWMKWKER